VQGIVSSCSSVREEKLLLVGMFGVEINLSSGIIVLGVVDSWRDVVLFVVWGVFLGFIRFYFLIYQWA
jgi:hypothetical protein